MAMPTIRSRRRSGTLGSAPRGNAFLGWLPSGNGTEESADHPWLGEEGDPLHPAGALGALKDIDPEHHLEQLRPRGSVAVAAFLGIVAQDVSRGSGPRAQSLPGGDGHGGGLGLLGPWGSILTGDSSTPRTSAIFDSRG